MRRGIFLLLAAIVAVTAQGKSVRKYHDAISAVADTVILLPVEKGASAVAVEIRSRFVGSGAGSIGIRWNISAADTYDEAVVKSDGRQYDTVHPDEAALIVRHVCSGVATVVDSIRVASPLGMTQAFHSLSVEGGMGEMPVVGFGHGIPEAVASGRYALDSTLPVAIVSGGAAEIDLLVTDCLTDDLPEWYKTIIDDERIEASLGSSEATPVGVWEYLDRDTDSRRAMSGGRYRLAIIPSGDAFDIVYLSGAEVQGDSWKRGMLKGRLVPTRFVGHYDLEWVDSSHKLIDRDIHATIEQDAILTLSFPLYKSVIRFSLASDN